ncbi:MAG: SDR family oxidoreductase [Candidatus Limnocylindrales bacterium]
MPKLPGDWSTLATLARTDAVPLRRMGYAAEVAPMYLWLCTDEASYATGGFFVVDGGLTAV